jgi:hypothetical protein
MHYEEATQRAGLLLLVRKQMRRPGKMHKLDPIGVIVVPWGLLPGDIRKETCLVDEYSSAVALLLREKVWVFSISVMWLIHV